MKAQLVSLRVYEGTIGWAHGAGFNQVRVLVPEADNLAVWTFGDNVCIVEKFNPGKTEDYTVVRDIELPDDLLQLILGFKEARRTLHDKISVLLSKSSEG